MFKVRDRSEIIRAAINDLLTNSSISNLSPGSKARAIVEAIGTVQGAVSTDLSIGEINSLLPNATGSTLDLLADMVGLQRLGEVRAKVETNDNNLKYYVKTGTFGDINSGTAITIPPGTTVRTSTDRGRDDAIMVQRNEVTLPAGGNEVYFAADQVGSVQERGIGANALVRHDYVGYTDSAFSSLLVTNQRGVSGRATETDQNLRFRIANRFAAAAEANLSSIRLNALLVPGVSDIKIVTNKSGIGSFDVVVFGNSPAVSDSIIQQVQEQVDRHQAVGSRGIAVAPRLLGVSMRVSLVFTDDAASADKNSAASSVRSAIRQYITDLSPGDRFVPNRLVRVILNAHVKIQDLGDPNNPFEQILVWRSTTDGNRFSRNLNQNILIQDDEEMVVEPYIDTPIEVIEA